MALRSWDSWALPLLTVLTAVRTTERCSWFGAQSGMDHGMVVQNSWRQRGLFGGQAFVGRHGVVGFFGSLRAVVRRRVQSPFVYFFYPVAGGVDTGILA